MSLQQRLCYVLFCANIVILCKITNEYGHKLLEQDFYSSLFVKNKERKRLFSRKTAGNDRMIFV